MGGSVLISDIAPVDQRVALSCSVCRPPAFILTHTHTLIVEQTPSWIVQPCV